MSAPELNRPVDDFEAPATGDQTIRLSDLKGQNVLIYFYPKDNTPGCTQEGQDFRDLYSQFEAAGAEVLGISRDSVRSHENFKAKYEFPFPLLSDKDEQACEAFGAIVEKKLYGKVYMGIDRSTYLFDAKGKLRQKWNKVRVKGHAQAVLEALQAL